jgi:hypothetical protein
VKRATIRVRTEGEFRRWQRLAEARSADRLEEEAAQRKGGRPRKEEKPAQALAQVSEEDRSDRETRTDLQHREQNLRQPVAEVSTGRDHSAEHSRRTDARLGAEVGASRVTVRQAELPLPGTLCVARKIPAGNVCKPRQPVGEVYTGWSDGCH